ncbi:SDR family NAD(P)-dependent oxidoreductase [Candidatus Gracilibacteria bacterium]|nr:SDR family NAD(P)-dependent oxidoreductase [Candidatus Gracilibacteria bacterium]
MLKTIAQEWPTVSCKAVDLDPTQAAYTLAAQLYDEIIADDHLIDVGYVVSRRRTMQAVPADLPQQAEAQVNIDRTSVVLVTGGARGITAEVAYALATRYQPTLVLVGSSPAPPPDESPLTAGRLSPKELKLALINQAHSPNEEVALSKVDASYKRLLKEREIRATLQRIKAAGANVEYVQVDVRDEQAVTHLVEHIYRSYGRLDGLIHGAGIIEDKLLVDKQPDSFDRVFDTKVDGAFLFSRAIHAESLRFTAFFASSAGAFGNRGQCDYAAANGVLNKLAQYLNQRTTGRVVSINWGAWAAGMVSPELAMQFAANGIGLLSVDTGCQAFNNELRYGVKQDAEVVIVAEAVEPNLQVAPGAKLMAHFVAISRSLAWLAYFPARPICRATGKILLRDTTLLPTRHPKQQTSNSSMTLTKVLMIESIVGAGGFLGPLATFDPAQYGVPPASVDGSDPEQWLALKVAYAAFADAGYRSIPDEYQRTSVILGRSGFLNRGTMNQFQHGIVVEQTLDILRSLHPEYSNEDFQAIRDELQKCLPPFNPDQVTGLTPHMAAGRIANRLNLKGPSYTVDAACAASLIAVELGVRDLLSGYIDLALVGGINVAAPIVLFQQLSQLGALSRQARIRPFDQDADGTILGEGLGMVVLKRREDAIRDGDRIYALIKGVGSSSDGRGLGLTAPQVAGEILALERAYAMADLPPHTIGLIEAHGTGTPIGDATELEALAQVFGSRTGRLPFCAIGSVKSMIGHLTPASGIAGLIKTTLALYHKVLPPTLHVDVAHSKLLNDHTPFYLNTVTRPWIHGDVPAPRRAGVNAFGFGGINAHVVLEEHRDADEANSPSCQLEWESELCILAAPSRQALITQLQQLLSVLEATSTFLLKDLAYTLSLTSGSQRCRLAIIATSLDDLRHKLVHALASLNDPTCRQIKGLQGCYFSEEPPGATGKLAFVFPGEGSQYINMLADLCIHFPEVRHWFDLSNQPFIEQHSDSLPRDVFFPLPTIGSHTTASSERSLWQMDVALAGVLAADSALNMLLKRLEICPDAVVGHSSGGIYCSARCRSIKS